MCCGGLGEYHVIIPQAVLILFFLLLAFLIVVQSNERRLIQLNGSTQSSLLFLSYTGMAALNGGLGSGGLSNGTGSTMEALTQAYSGIQQYAAAALPTLYNQSLLTQQSIGAAGSQKEGRQKLASNFRGVFKRASLALASTLCCKALICWHCLE